MTRDFNERRDRMAALLEEAFESGALVFSEPLLDALEATATEEFSGHARTEHGITYTIERKLGRGGMATVYLARDPKHDRPIAIKVLHADLTARVGAQRFVREIRLTARLQHPHVLGLLDSGVFERSDREADALAGRPYYTMPYVEGESLRVRLAREGALPLPDAMRVLREVADALSYAHELGVIHRDIKPENILLSHGHAVVADFGIAKALDAAQRSERPDGRNPNEPLDGASPNEPWSAAPIAVTQSSTLLGTPGYMAPEQAAAEAHIDHRADLYAWGVVAYEILTGRHPFGATGSAAGARSAPMAEVPRPIRDVAPSVAPALGALVMRCLAKAPSDRPGSAVEVVTALDAAAIGARVDRPSFRGMSRRARRGVTAALGTMLVLVAAILYASLRTHPMCSFFDRSLWQQLARRQPAIVWTGKQAVVVGTCNPALDVAAVQTAVDRAETVVLDGNFSFRQPPTKPVDPILSSSSPATAPSAQIRVAKSVTILGSRDTSGGMTTIDGGTIPFYIDAAGARVTIRNLRFVRPIQAAIAVHAAHDLEIDLNRIEGLVPFKGAGAAIMINPSGNIPRPSGAGRAGDVSGSLTISRNHIDLSGGPAGVYALGVAVFSAGQSRGAEVNLDIDGNRIRNTTSAITVRRVIGHIRLFNNVAQTGSERVGGDYEAIRLVNTGSYWMANNTIECRWANCIGIAVFSQSREWPIQSAVIEHNQVKMSPPPGPVLADSSAAIEIKGFAHSNVVQYNTIRGFAHTALAIRTFKGGYPEDNAFIDNDLEGFHASLASTLVGSGVLRTRLVHPGTVVDRGVSTTTNGK